MEQLLEDFTLSLFIMQIIVFILLIVGLKKFAWKPILESINQREENIKNALFAAKEAKKQMEFLTSENEKKLKEATLQRDSILKEAHQIKNEIIEKAKQEASKQSDLIIAKAQKTIGLEKKVAISEIQSQVANLSVDIAKKILEKELSSEKEQLAFVNDLLKK